MNEKTRDTVFKGTACKFRGLNYLSEQINDSSYWISAVKISDNLIYGLGTNWTQMWEQVSAVKSGQYKKLLKYISADTSRIRLHPDIKEMRLFYSQLINEMIPDTILVINEKNSNERDTSILVSMIDAEEFNIASRAFPNPCSNFISIQLHDNTTAKYYLNDMNGKTVLKGEFKDIINRLKLNDQAEVIYALTLQTKDNSKETIKILKTK